PAAHRTLHSFPTRRSSDLSGGVVGEAEPEPVKDRFEGGRGHDAGGDTRDGGGRCGGGHGPRCGGGEGGGVGDDGGEGGQDRGDRGEGLKRGAYRAAVLRGHGGFSNRRGGGPAARWPRGGWSREQAAPRLRAGVAGGSAAGPPLRPLERGHVAAVG